MNAAIRDQFSVLPSRLGDPGLDFRSRPPVGLRRKILGELQSVSDSNDMTEEKDESLL